MDDNARMIAAARRLARRTAKKTDLTYQQALDRVARDLGREHWAAFAADPVEVPRDEPPEPPVGEVGAIRVAPHDGSAIDRNPLDEAFVGASVRASAREKRVQSVAAMLIPATRARAYFAEKGRLTLEGFLMAEIAAAAHAGRSASIPAMIGWINDGLRRAGDAREAMREEGRDVDALSLWLGRVILDVEPHQGADYVRDRLAPLVSMAPNERSGILGTMDQGLIPYKRPAAAART